MQEHKGIALPDGLVVHLDPVDPERVALGSDVGVRIGDCRRGNE